MFQNFFFIPSPHTSNIPGIADKQSVKRYNSSHFKNTKYSQFSIYALG